MTSNLNRATILANDLHRLQIGRTLFLLEVEGVTFGHTTEAMPAGLLVEGVGAEDPDEPEAGIDITVWTDQNWMIGIGVQGDQEVVVEYTGDPFDGFAPVPDRSKQFRVHGTWHDATNPPAHVAWAAPTGYPIV